MYVLQTDSDAPWNRGEQESVTERKKVFLYVSKEMDLTTYDTEIDEDEDGKVAIARKDADWHQAYEDDDLNLSGLLKILGSLAGCRIKELERDCQDLSIPLTARRQKYFKLSHWRRIAEACGGWKIEEVEIDDV